MKSIQIPYKDAKLLGLVQYRWKDALTNPHTKIITFVGFEDSDLVYVDGSDYYKKTCKLRYIL